MSDIGKQIGSAGLTKARGNFAVARAAGYAVGKSLGTGSDCRLLAPYSARLKVLLVMAIALSPISAQNQTPANVPPSAAATWTDLRSGLMWVGEDNGSDVTQSQALDYCRNFSLAGFHDWRLPEIGELVSIYDASVNEGDWRIRGGIKITGWSWSGSSGERSGEAWTLVFIDGSRSSVDVGGSGLIRTLCVRRAGQ